MKRLTLDAGAEWLVDATGCAPERLRSRRTLRAVFARIIDEMALHPVARSVWHSFPGSGGLTGMVVLSESHLACHTFPERGYAAFSLYCCRARPQWPWAERLAELLDARNVTVQHVPRGGGPARRRR